MSIYRLFCVGGFLICLLGAEAMGQAPLVVDAKSDPLPQGALMRMGSSRLAHGDWLTCVQFSADDRWVGAADSGGAVRLWETATGALVWEKPEDTGRTLAFSPDGKSLAIGGYYNQEITLWDLKTGEVIRELPQNARALEFSRDGALLAAAIVLPATAQGYRPLETQADAWQRQQSDAYQ